MLKLMFLSIKHFTQASSGDSSYSIVYFVVYKNERKGFMKGVSSKFNVCIRRQIVLVQIFATDEKGRIRIDDLEMRPDVQEKSSKVVERSG
jgi:enoyl-[acyl-carrier protein] reductase/trans-2-enoyl-CoA reductase (NAD+)